MSNNSVSLHRVLKANPAKVYRAFSEANAMAAWFPPYGYLCQVDHMDFKVGGTYKMTFFNFSTGHGHSFSGKYVEIKPNEFIKFTDHFEDPNMPGEITTTISLREVVGGNTELKVLQENIPVQIPADMCYLGWQDSLDKLMRLVEPNIPDGQ